MCTLCTDMFHFISILILAGITVLAVSLQKTYSSVPVKELKRRARGGDEVAALLFRVVGYGISLQLLLWLIVALSTTGFLLVTARSLPGWLAFIGSFILLWVAFAWLPQSRVTATGEWLAAKATPVLDWLLGKLHPVLDRAAHFIRTSGHLHIHTGLYQKEDLLELLERQNGQLDSRISLDELALARHALVFEDKVVRDIMTPRRVVKMVDKKESVGPLLLDELHKSGFSRFPVFETKQDNVVGTLYLRTLVEKKSTGSVGDVMSKRVYYVNEDQPLGHVLKAFLKTKHHLFIVVNKFEEISGVVTIEDILEQLIGRKIVDEFDKYDDLREVAALQAKKEQKNHPKPAEEEADLAEPPK